MTGAQIGKDSNTAIGGDACSGAGDNSPLTAGQLSTLLEGCEWRALARNLRPELAG